MEWITNIDKKTLEAELTFKEVIKLRKQCEKMYDCIKHVSEVIGDAYERPKVDLPEDVYRLRTACQVIIGHIDIEQKV